MAREATRRHLLTATAAALPLRAAGCKGIAALGPPPRPAPDVTVATDAIAVETGLIAAYGQVLAARPGLAPVLRPLLADHHEHLARLRARLIVPVGGQPLPRPRGTAHRTAPAPGSPTAPAPRTPAAALRHLRDAEDAASGALLAHLAGAPPSLAQLLASISASEATHALVLGAAARQP